MSMQVQDLALNGAKLLLPVVHRDARGWFAEQYRCNVYRQWLGTDVEFVQSNVSHSAGGVLRGLHLQLRKPQGKLICVLQGRIQDVIVDVRPQSPDFGQALSVMLNATDMPQLWVPPGFAHGFAVLSDQALVSYQCTAYYDPTDEACLRWDDPALNIAWMVDCPLLSPKDQQGWDLHALREQLVSRGEEKT